MKNDSLAGDANFIISIREKCKNLNIPLGFFDDINNNDFVIILKSHNPDLIVYGGAPLIKEKVINLPLGVTVFKVDAGVDSGPILLIRNLKQSIVGKKLNEIESMVEGWPQNLCLRL